MPRRRPQAGFPSSPLARSTTTAFEPPPGRALRGRPLDLETPRAAARRTRVVEAPVVAGDQYAVSGTVVYENVEGVGYLEMWSEFPDGGRYFSRSLDVGGPMRKLSGTSAERAFTLPFFPTPGAPRPVRL